jgi:hypothetical protein
MNGIWKKTLKRFVYDFKGFAKDEAAKISKAVGEMACKFNLGVDEDDIEDLLEAVPEELTNVGGVMFIDDLFYSLSVQMLMCMIDYKAMESLVQCIAGTTVLGL